MCKQCGRPAEHAAVDIGAGSNVVIENHVWVGGCTYCGGDLRALDGRYVVRDEMAVLLSGPEWSMKELRRITRLLEEAAPLADSDPEAALALVEKKNHSVGAFLRRANELNTSPEAAGLKAIMKWLAGAATGVYGVRASVGGNLSWDEIGKVVEDALRALGS